MLERVRELPGIEMALDDYCADFATTYDGVSSSWKLERRQDFIEPDEPSWVAAASGDWETAMRLAGEDERGEDVEDQRGLNERGVVRHRLRIVDHPVSNYLRWELPVLAVTARLGERIRVGAPDLVKPYEIEGELAEVVGLGDAAMYHILYDERGALAGGRKITDPEAIDICHREVLELWEQGEEIAGYVRREIAPLIPFLP